MLKMVRGCRERWGEGSGPRDETTRTELQALFDVVGTPSWAVGPLTFSLFEQNPSC